jgi:type I restriction enzyme S subunit
MGTALAKQIVKLGQCLERVVDNRGKTPPLAKSGIELLEVNAIAGGRKSPTFENVHKYISEETYATWFRSGHPRRGDILISTVGAIGRVAFVQQERGCIAQNVVALRPNPNVLDGEFLYYYLASTETQNRLLSLNIGVAQPSLKVPHLLSLNVEIPALPVQRRIADILSVYDELIENGQRRVRILEAMARALYREWFVHFRFPGHEKLSRIASPLGDIPEGWEVRTVKDVATVTYGFPFASKKFNTEGVGTPVIRIRDILDGSINTFTDEQADPRYHIKNGDILVGMDGDFHMCIWSSGHALQNQRVAKFEPNGEIGNYHLFLALELPIQTWNNSIVGTTVAHLGDMHIKTIQIVWPPTKILTKARDILEPMSEQIIALKRQIQNLRRTRDLLLPRLLSGQIDVSEK